MADEEEDKNEAIAPAVEPTEAPAVPAAPAPPAALANKLHEWGAAALLMLVLAAILYTFLTFIRGASM